MAWGFVYGPRGYSVDALVLSPIDLSAATKVGGRVFSKQILPVGSTSHGGERLDFTRERLESMAELRPCHRAASPRRQPRRAVRRDADRTCSVRRRRWVSPTSTRRSPISV